MLAFLVVAVQAFAFASAQLSVLPTPSTKAATNNPFYGPQNPNPAVKVKWENIGENPIVAVNMGLVPGTDTFLYTGRASGAMVINELLAGTFDLAARKWTNVSVPSNVFCNGFTQSTDGRIIVFGGHSRSKGGIPNGLADVREFDIRKDPTTMKSIAKMAHERWYPTPTLMGDGKMMVFGGSVDPNENSPSAPDNEVWDPTAPVGATLKKFPAEATYLKAVFQNFYPHSYLLPTGEIIQFLQRQIRIIKADGSYRMIKGTYSLGPVFPDPNMDTEYPKSATGCLLPLKPDRAGQYTRAEFMIFGGAPKQNHCIHNGTVNGVPVRLIPANRNSYRLQVAWSKGGDGDWIYTFGNYVKEDMGIPRVGGDAVPLPNGDVVVFHGAQTGCSGGTENGIARNSWPAFWPVLYNPDLAKGGRYTVMEATPIARMYHNAAVLTKNGTIFVGGCDACQPRPITSNATFWSRNTNPVPRLELRNEIFYPPHYLDMDNKPRIVSINGNTDSSDIPILKHNTTYSLTWDNEVAGKTGRVPVTSVVLVAPGSTTHGFNPGQKVVYLVNKINLAAGTLTFTTPPDVNVAPPKYYLMFINNRKTYSTARWVRLVL